MSDDWEAEDFEPREISSTTATDKWVGEDEDDNIKDTWDASDDEKEQSKEGEEKAEGTAYQRPKKKPLADRIAEKAAKKEQDLKTEKEKNREPTAEEKLAEKIKLQKIQQAADLKHAEDIFGVKHQTIESMFPETEEEFTKFRVALKTKITDFEASKFYPAFIEQLFQDLALGLQSEDLKKVGTSLNGLYHEKEKQRKEAERKKKKKQKASLNIAKKGDLDLLGDVGEYEYGDGEDFM